MLLHLQVQAFLLSASLAATVAAQHRVALSARRKRRAARQAREILSPDLAAANSAVDANCAAFGESCGWLSSNCCEGTVCGGILNRECYHDPALEGEFCSLVYHCDSDLACVDGTCTDYADLIDVGVDEGTCAAGSATGELTVMTYNTFLLEAGMIGGTFDNPFTGEAVARGFVVPSQNEDARERRVARLAEWAKTRNEDVIAVQELFTFTEDVVAGMVAAGYCHYAATPLEQEAGKAIFSRYPIVEVDFWDFYDFDGKNSVMHPWEEGLAAGEMVSTDRGVLLAKIEKDGNKYNILNTHTMSDSGGDMHSHRLLNYLLMREAADGIPADEAVFFVGDMNEDKYTYEYGAQQGDLYYQRMLEELRAVEPAGIDQEAEMPASYDTTKNPLPAFFQSGDYAQLLDYVLYSRDHAAPATSSCEIVRPLWPLDCDNEFECQLSDHYPVICHFTFAQEEEPMQVSV